MKLKYNNSTQSGFFGTLQVQKSCLNFCEPYASCFEPEYNFEFEIWIKTLIVAFKKKDNASGII
ncbi:hypothetical protein A3C59_03845 [Candidatus Daviesbacteria bacterium RIFCSPHIGHO2_02_FULL_36_13]|uniref:Uncharacterized protein n=1 Tax=Candidatus Daviesbacteria bacterium RIFCSPHIGHO2_02_FULL_36_13 TaxID=1797768 RepID=A0A1F5JV86_9BACT|nr:MAG: hypothetical protein A3C59_03845 [Candidatus Daviesbacteria bacterium RIFCSPHIGHO2_02_FULL_36_13]